MPIVNGLANDYSGWLDVFFYDVENGANDGIARQYGVRGLPTIVILNSTGNAVQTLVGFRGEAQLRSAVEQVMSG